MKVKGKLFNWIGGKKWLAKDLSKVFSKYNDFDSYAEPFTGGLGSFLFTIETLKKNNIKNVYLNDINKSIIAVYSYIKSDYNTLYNEYIKIESAYKNTIPLNAYTLHKTKEKKELKKLLINSQSFFLDIRKEFNLIKNNKCIRSSACFLFLMEHCFNSVYRENLSGFFNSPYNWETGVPKFELKHEIFTQYSEIFNSMNVEFYNESCFTFLDMIKEKEKKEKILMYADPPYLNIDKAENKYNKDHFGLSEQKNLIDYYKSLKNVVFSNHSLDIFHTFCSEYGFDSFVFDRANIMSSKSENRKNKVAEILAYKKKDK